MLLSLQKKKDFEATIKAFIALRGGNLDEGWHYISCREKMTITCEKGHRWQASWPTIKGSPSYPQGHWCPRCSGSVIYESDIRELVNSKGGKFEKNWKYINNKTKFSVTCIKGHTWITNASILRNSDCWCPYCKKNRVLEESVRKFIEQKGGTLEPFWKYKNCDTKFNVECEKGHIWETSWNVIQSDHWCPHCRIYKKEQQFRKTIEAFFGAPFPSKRPSWLRYPPTGKLLELDGYNEKNKLAFEYQGPQHYEPCFFNKKNPTDNKKRDDFKKITCEKNGIKLIIVPHWLVTAEWLELIKANTSRVIC